MAFIGLMSDSHGLADEHVFTFFKDVDQIWHAGDIGNLVTYDRLSVFKPLRAVYGNIDDNPTRCVTAHSLRFTEEEMDVFITHIGGYPGKYDKKVKPMLLSNPPGLFICGHSHILRIMYDKRFNFLYINPGASGNQGFHKVKTLVRFKLEKNRVKDLEISEVPRV